MADYYVNPSVGNDGNGGTHPTTDAWATTQKAADTCIAGDTCGFVTGTTETVTGTTNFDTNAGTGTAPIIFYACDSSGNRHTDNTRYVIQLTSFTVYMIRYTSASRHVYWYNVEFDGNSNCIYVLDHTTGNAGDNTHYNNCIIHDANIYCASMYGCSVSFVRCELYGSPFALAATSAAYSRWKRILVTYCKIHDTGSHAIINLADQVIIITHNLIYDNFGDGIQFAAAGVEECPLLIDHNVFFNNARDGISLNAARSYNTQITHNCFVKNGRYGFGVPSAIALDAPFIDYNQYHDNTSGHCEAVSDVNINDGTVGYHNVIGDPSFTSEVDGSEDFTPLPGSNLIQAGINNSNIGAIAQASGINIHPGMTGGIHG